MDKPLSVLQHRTWYQKDIHINAISLKRLHVVNEIAGSNELWELKLSFTVNVY